MVAPIAKTAEDESIDWAAIERAYESCPDKLTDIAARFRISRQKIQFRAKQRGWRRADGARGRRRSAKIPEPFDAGVLAEAEEASGARRRRMVARLFKALDDKMTQIEKRIARARMDDSEQSASDSEREARALSALAGLYAKLVELDEAAGREDRQQQSEAPGDADHFREDLARRLERLNQGKDA